MNPGSSAAVGQFESKPEESGLASGVVNTSFMMGGTVGLAVLASLAAARTGSLAGTGMGSVAALNGGYQAAFLVGAVFAAIAAALSAVLLRPGLQGHASAAQEQAAHG